MLKEMELNEILSFVRRHLNNWVMPKMCLSMPERCSEDALNNICSIDIWEMPEKCEMLRHALFNIWTR